jgi:methyl-accepting chemotaxis protein
MLRLRVPRQAAPGASVSDDDTLALVSRTTARVRHKVTEATTFTERAVLGCGEDLSTLLDTIRALVDESDRESAEAAARTRAITSGFVDGIQADMAAQRAAVEDVLRLADGIQSATAAIERLTQMSHILSLNMRIEATRAGEYGHGFSVIATHMQEMAGTIRSATDEVNAAVGGVRTSLPAVMAHSRSMQERAQRFIGEMAAETTAAKAQAGGGHNPRLDTVVRLSNAALSHLQFFDPLVKQLSDVSREVEQCEQRLRRLHDGDAGAAVADEPDVADQPTAEPEGALTAPGGLVLF